MQIEELKVEIEKIAKANKRYCFGADPESRRDYLRHVKVNVVVNNYNATPLLVVSVSLGNQVMATLDFNCKKSVKTIESEIHTWMLIVRNVMDSMNEANRQNLLDLKWVSPMVKVA